MRKTELLVYTRVDRLEQCHTTPNARSTGKQKPMTSPRPNARRTTTAEGSLGALSQPLRAEALRAGALRALVTTWALGMRDGLLCQLPRSTLPVTSEIFRIARGENRLGESSMPNANAHEISPCRMQAKQSFRQDHGPRAPRAARSVFDSFKIQVPCTFSKYCSFGQN